MAKIKLAQAFPEAAEEDWLQRVAETLKGRPFDSLVSDTLDGIRLKPLYRGASAPAPVLRRLPHQGEPAWTVVQRLDIPDMARANAQALEDIDNGAGGLVLVWPESVCAGASGLAAARLDDLKRLCDGVELDLIAVRLDAGRHGRRAAELLLELYEARHLDLARCDISFGLDPLGAFALTGGIVEESVLRPRLSQTVTAIAGRGHRGAALIADGRAYHGAGASEAQELAAVLASAVQYLRWLEAQGHAVEDVARRIAFLLTADADQVLTIAKLRAVRLLWARVEAAMGLQPEPVIVHAETSLRMMSRHDPHMNLLRTTTAAFAAGVGGADALAVVPFTAARGISDGFARRLARNIQLLLQEESGIGDVAEAAAGSGLIETATDELAAAAWKLFQSIEAEGGMLAALGSGLVQRLVGEAAAARRRAIAERRLGLTGVSEYPNLEAVPVELLDLSLPDDWRMPGDEAAEVTCARLVQERQHEPFEVLRDAADAQAERSGERPAVFLANLGRPAEFDARARWTRRLLAAGGVGAIETEGFDGPEAAAQAFRDSGAAIACLCSSDRVYGELAAAAARALKNAGATRVYLAGRPGEREAELNAAGVDAFVYEGIDAVAVLRRLQRELGTEETAPAT